MKLAIVLIFFSSLAIGQEWDSADKSLAAVAIGVTVIDWSQTLKIARNPEVYRETSPLLGSHPSVSSVNRHFLASLGVSYLVADALPSNYRKMFLAGYSAVELGYVKRNLSIGLRIGF